MAKPPSSSSDDRELFRKSVGSVRRLHDDRIKPESRRPGPHPLRHPADTTLNDGELQDQEPEWSDIEGGDTLFFARPGLQQRMIRKLRRGQFNVGAELDMHGMIVREARNALTPFLTDSRARGIRCVRIIHGKGLSSASGKPVLKVQIDHWLRQRPEVVAFCSARRNDGGTGAVYVLLKR